MPRYSSSFDGAQLFYRDFIPAARPPPFQAKQVDGTSLNLTLVFIHQWPLSSRMYDPLLLSLCETHRFRCVAVDRRGFGQSDWTGGDLKGDIDYSVLAQDVVDLLEKIKPGPFVFIAASMGTGETLLSYLRSSYIQAHCKAFLWISTCLPYPVASSESPGATPRQLWDSVLESLRTSRSQFVSTGLTGPLGIGEAAANLSEKDIELYERIFDAADALAIERAVQIYTSEDLTQQLAHFGQNSNVPLLLIHGEMDGGVPLAASAQRVQELVPRAQLAVYDGGGHVLVASHPDRLLKDILGFVSKISDVTAEDPRKSQL